MNEYSLSKSIVSEVGKSTPPLVVTGAMIAGMTINDWVAILTGIYVVLQIIVLARKELREYEARREKTNV